MYKRISSLIVTALLLTTPFLSSASAEEIEKQTVIVSEKEKFEKDVQYRIENNLDSSIETIKKAHKNPNAEKLAAKYSVPLTEEEKTYIQERDDLMEEVGNKIGQLMKSTHQFSQIGTFHQQTKGGLKFVVSFSENNEEVKAIKKEIKEIAPANMVIFKNVQHSEQDLVNLFDQIQSNNNQLKSKEINIKELSLNFYDNVVDIQLETKTKESENYLKDMYGSHNIKVLQADPETGVENRRANYWTMVGGLQIGQSAFTSTATNIQTIKCTLGFSAVKNGVYYFITAGHCIDNGVSDVYQGGKKIGAYHWHYHGNFADVGLVKRSSTVGASNGLYKYAYNDDQLQGYQRYASQMDVGDKVCMSGVVSGFECGDVTSTYTSGYDKYDNASLVGYMRASIDTTGGDSGAPYWYNDILLGIHHGGVGTSAKFTHIANAIKYGGEFTPLY